MDAESYRLFVSGFNRAVFPVHILCYVLGIGAAALVFVDAGRRADIVAKATLAVLWGWLGVFYMLGHYSRVASAGYTWGVLFLVQAAFFAGEAFFARYVALDLKLFRIDAGGITFRPYTHPTLGHVGAAVAGWAFVGYPVSALLLGRRWPALALFGAAPPIAIYTCGVLLFTFNAKPRWRFCFIPFLWALVGGFAGATEWHYYEDYASVAAAAVLLGAWVWAANKYKPAKK